MKAATQITTVIIVTAVICMTQMQTSSAQKRFDGNLSRGLYKLDTGDVIALYFTNIDSGNRDCVLHVVQVDGNLHLPFGEVRARQKTIAEVREELLKLEDQATKKQMSAISATVVDLRNVNNDQFLQNLH